MRKRTQSKAESAVPIPQAGIGTRIANAADRLGTRVFAASQIGVSPDSLQRYIREENEPPVGVVVRLARAAGLSVDWIATGEGPEAPTNAASQSLRIDAEILGKAVYVLDGVLRQIDSHMEPQAYAETLLMLVEYLREHSGALAPSNVVDLMEYIRSRQRGRERTD